MKNVINWTFDEVSVLLYISWKISRRNDGKSDGKLNNIVQLINKIPGGEKNFTLAEDLSEWFAPVIERDNYYTDEKIIKLVAGQNESRDESEDEDECPQKIKTLHSAVATAFETALEYNIQQYFNSSSRDIWFIQKWLKIAHIYILTARGKGKSRRKQLQSKRFFKPRERNMSFDKIMFSIPRKELRHKSTKLINCDIWVHLFFTHTSIWSRKMINVLGNFNNHKILLSTISGRECKHFWHFQYAFAPILLLFL